MKQLTAITYSSYFAISFGIDRTVYAVDFVYFV